VTRTATIRVISFVLFAACGALCQPRSSRDLPRELPFYDSNLPAAPRPEISTSRSLPDAPSAVQPPTQAERFHRLVIVNEARSPSTLGRLGAAGVGVGVNAGVMRETGFGHVTPGTQPSFILHDHYEAVFTREDSRNFVDKYLYPSVKHDPRYHPSTNGSVMGRASDAASRIFITRDDSGKGRLNTSYFFGVLTSVALHAAYRPYWARSSSETFNNFGSTIGSDAGLNLFNEFRPGILQMVKGYTPKFVSRIGAAITNDPPRAIVPSTAR
jgi:hypothetical protein